MKKSFKPGTMIYPLPAVLVSCGATADEYNVLTVSWTGTVCSNPPMCYAQIFENATDSEEDTANDKHTGSHRAT